MTSQGLEVGPFAIDQVEHQQPTEDQLVPMVKTRPQYPQVLRHAVGQTAQGHSLGLLVNT
jgi:hypothetical protein